MGSAPTRAEVLSLFRSLLRTARELTDYNIREYTKRRTVDAFRHNHRLNDHSAATAAFADGKSQLAVAKRTWWTKGIDEDNKNNKNVLVFAK